MAALAVLCQPMQELKPIFATLQQAEGLKNGLGYSAARYLPRPWWYALLESGSCRNVRS